MQAINMVLAGLLVGLAARLLMPGKHPGGFVVTLLLGLAGAVVGSLIASYFQIAGGWFTNFAMSVIGAMLLLGLFRLVREATASTS